MEQLTSVHESLQNAALQNAQEQSKIITTSFKCDEETISLAHKICRSNGTNLSSYLRECCKSLIGDYTR